ncbi:MAG: DUF3300 domain-containing protein [Burkholderiales bacterium]
MRALKRFHSSSRSINALCLIPLVLTMSVRAQDSKPFSKEELDQMMPIALYPDSLTSQLRMASTYPAEGAEAEQWSKASSRQAGDAAVIRAGGQSIHKPAS